MGTIKLLASLLRALTAYWELKKETHAHDAYKESRKACKELEDKIERLRSTGNESHTQLADRLLPELLEERAHLKRLSAFNPGATGGGAGPG